MNWSGKVLGGLFGGIVGGPLGAGLGATVGHYVADRGAVAGLELVQLGWVHHAFGASGPGVRLRPAWRARGLQDADVTVRVDAAGLTRTVVMVPEAAAEEVDGPEWLVPYARFGEGETAEVRVMLRAGNHGDGEVFRLPMPRPVRRLGNSGPGRVVMALVSAARAGGRALEEGDVAWIRGRFLEGQALDADGERWFAAWVEELRGAEFGRLGAEVVAERLQAHVDADGAERVVVWLMHGCQARWRTEAGVRWVEEFAAGLGVGDVERLWERVSREPDPEAVVWARGVLGVGAGDDVKAAYRRLVMAAHPDRATGPEDAAWRTARTAEINRAFGVLRG